MAQSTADNQVKVAGALAKVYAGALWDLAVDAGKVEEVAEELRQLCDMVNDQPDLRLLFASPAIKMDRRRASIDAIFAGRVSTLTYRFLHVLNRKGRLDQLASIRLAFDQRLKQEHGEVDVDVYTAHELDASQQEAIAAKISTAINRKAVVAAHVTPDMLGGLKMQIGDRLIDGSVATQLNNLKRRMITSGRRQGGTDAWDSSKESGNENQN